MNENPKDTGVPPRRRFLQAMGAIVAGGLALLAPVLAGVATILDPLRRREEEAEMVKVTNLSVVPDDGIPIRVTVSTDRVDGWTTYQNTPVGAAYLRRTEEGLQALNVVCPHAGCFVNLAPDRSHFQCPCHRSRFALDGTQIYGPAPRGLDELAVDVRNNDEVWVRFQQFRPGAEHKVPIV